MTWVAADVLIVGYSITIVAAVTINLLYQGYYILQVIGEGSVKDSDNKVTCAKTDGWEDR